MFEQIQSAPPDPIFALMHRFNQDDRANKINLTVGVFQDENGATPVLGCVKAAETQLLAEEKTKSYLGIGGLESFNAATRSLVLGKDHPAIQAGRAAAIQTPGGTGALRLAADFVADLEPEKTIYCTDPTWPNHLAIFDAAGAGYQPLPYLNHDMTSLEFENYHEQISKLEPGNAVLLHTCCHNPSGFDPNPDQWTDLLCTIRDRELFPIFDFAYQGFYKSTDEDSWPIRKAIELGSTVFVCSSYSKNMGLYAERVGGLTVIAPSSDVCHALISRLKSYARAIYSNPPQHGAAVVSNVLGNAELREQWQAELSGMRVRLKSMRGLFVETLATVIRDHDFSAIARQTGMFSYTGLTAEQADRLLDEHAIYMLRSGRVNVAGINNENVRRLSEAIGIVLQETEVTR